MTAKLPTLDSFIKDNIEGHIPHSAYVTEPGWKSFYVRAGPYHIHNLKKRYPSIVLANIEAKKKGEGTFKQLVKRLRNDYPGLFLCVECVQTRQFIDGLLRMGFVEDVIPGAFSMMPKNLYLPPNE